MPSSVDFAVDYYLDEISSLTGMSAREVDDFLSLTPEQQLAAVEGYKAAQSWVHDPGTVSKVVAVFEALAGIAGAVSGITGALAAVRNL